MNALALLLGLGFGFAAAFQDAKDKEIDSALLYAFVGAGALVFLFEHGTQLLAIALIPAAIAFALYLLNAFASGDVYAVLGYSLFFPFYFGQSAYPVPLMTAAIAAAFVFLALFTFTKQRKFGQYPFLPFLLAGVVASLALKLVLG